MTLPSSLRTWFTLHFIIDYLFALPLFFAPIWTLELLGFQTIDPIATRLVAAALFAIGGTSLLMRHAGKEAYKTMLTLKLLWSGTAIFGFLIVLLQGAPRALWLFLVIFMLFFGVWAHYLRRL